MSNLFKYTKRVLTSVLAAAVVLTAIPSTAFGAEVDGDVAIDVLETEVAEAGEEVVVENEDAVTTDGASGDEEVIVEGEDEDPDQAKADLTLTIPTPTGLTIKSVDAGDTPVDITATLDAGLAIDSTMDFKAILVPDADKKLKVAPVNKIEWKDYSEEATIPGTGKDAKADANSDPKVDTLYTIGTTDVEGYGKGSRLLTIPTATLAGIKEEHTAKDGKRVAATAKVTLEASVAADFTIEPVTANEGVVVESLGVQDRTKSIDADYSLKLDKAIASSSRKNITDRRNIKVTFTVLNSENEVLYTYKPVTVASTGLEALTADEKAQWEGASAKKWAEFVAYAADDANAAINIDNTALELAYAKDYKIAVYFDCSAAGAAEKVSVTDNAGHATFYVGNAVDESKKVVNSGESATKTDKKVDFVFSVKAEDASNSGTKKLKRVYYTIGSKTYYITDPTNPDADTETPTDLDALAASITNVTIPAARVTDNIALYAETAEEVRFAFEDGTPNYSAGFYLTNGTVPTSNPVVTGQEFKFEIHVNRKTQADEVKYYKGTDTKGVAITPVGGVYTVPNVDDTVVIKASTIVGAKQHAVKTAADYSGDVIVLALNGENTGSSNNVIDENNTKSINATDGKPFYFSVTDDGEVVESVSYSMGDQTGVTPETAGLAAGVYKIPSVTDDVKITVGSSDSMEITSPANTQVKTYFPASASKAYAANDDYTISQEDSFSFKIEKKDDSVTVGDVYFYQGDKTFKPSDPTTKTTKIGTGENTYTLDIPSIVDPAGDIKLDASKGIKLYVETKTAVKSTSYKPVFYAVDPTKDTDHMGEEAIDETNYPYIINTFSSKTTKNATTLTSQKIKLAVGDSIALTSAELDSDPKPAPTVGLRYFTDLTQTTLSTKTFANSFDTELKTAKTAANEKVVEVKEFKNDAGPTLSSVGIEAVKVGTDTITATTTRTTAAGDEATYTATIEVEVVAPYTDIQIDEAFDSSAITVADPIASTSDYASFQLCAKEGRTGLPAVVEPIAAIAAASPYQVDSFKWELVPSMEGKSNKQYGFFEYTDGVEDSVTHDMKDTLGTNNSATNKAGGIKGQVVKASVAQASPVTVKATVTWGDGKTTSYTRTLAMTETKADDYVVAVSLSGTGRETELTGSSITDGSLALSSADLKTAKVDYAVYKNVGGVSWSGITAKKIGDWLKDGDIEPATGVEFKNDTKLVAYDKSNNPIAKTNTDYNVSYATVSGTAGSYTATGVKKTNDAVNLTSYLKLEPTITVDGIVVTSLSVKFVVSDKLAKQKVDLLLNDVNRSDGKPYVNTLKTSYTTGKGAVSIIDDSSSNIPKPATEDITLGVELTEIASGSLLKLPEASDFTAVQPGRVLIGWTQTKSAGSEKWYNAGDEVKITSDLVSAGDAFTAVWMDEYQIDGFYNGNVITSETDSEGKVKWSNVVSLDTASPALTTDAKIPVSLGIHKIKNVDKTKADKKDIDTVTAAGVYTYLETSEDYLSSGYTLSVDPASEALAGSVDAAELANRKIVAKSSASGLKFKAVYKPSTAEFTKSMTTGVTISGSSDYEVTLKAEKTSTEAGEEAFTITAKITDGGADDVASVAGFNAGTSVSNFKFDWTIDSASKNNATIESDWDATGPSGANTATFTPVAADDEVTVTFSATDANGKVLTPATAKIKINNAAVRLVVEDTDKKAVDKVLLPAYSSGEFLVKAVDSTGAVITDGGTWSQLAGDDVIVDTGATFTSQTGGYWKVVAPTDETTSYELNAEGEITLAYKASAKFGGKTYEKKIPVETYFTLTLTPSTAVTGAGPYVTVNGTPVKNTAGTGNNTYVVKVGKDKLVETVTPSTGFKSYSYKNISLADYSAVALDADGNVNPAKEFTGWTGCPGVAVVTTEIKELKSSNFTGGDIALTATLGDTKPQLSRVPATITLSNRAGESNDLYQTVKAGLTPYTTAAVLWMTAEDTSFFKMFAGDVETDTGHTYFDANGAYKLDTDNPWGADFKINGTASVVGTSTRTDTFTVGAVKGLAGTTKIKIYSEAPSAIGITAGTEPIATVTLNVNGLSTDASGRKSYWENGEKLKKQAKKVGNDTYYFDEEGFAITTDGITTIDGKTVLLKDGKLAAKGLQDYKSSTYFVGDEGVILTGWLTAEGATATAANGVYYADPANDGKLAQGYYKVGSDFYVFDKNFKKVTAPAGTTGYVAYKVSETSTKYIDTTGKVAIAQLITVDGKQYLVNEDGELVTYAMTTAGKITVGGVKYVVAEDNTAKRDDIWYNPTVTWTQKFPSKWDKKDSIPVVAYTVTYTSANDGKSYTTDSIIADVTPKTVASSATEVTFTATADLSAYSKDKAGTQKAENATLQKTYKFANGGEEGKSGQEVDPEGDITIEGLEDSYPWTGKQIKPTFSVYDSVAGKYLAKGVDYTVKYGKNKDAGTKAGTITITGKGNYAKAGTAATFDIVKEELSDPAGIVKSIAKLDAKDYTGSPIYPDAISVTLEGGSTVTMKHQGDGVYSNEDIGGKELAVSVTNNVDKGSATVAVWGAKKNGKDAVKTATFKINAKSMEGANKEGLGNPFDVTISKTADFRIKTTRPEVNIKFHGNDLIEGQDYKIDVNVKKGTVKVSGKGNFNKNFTENFTINPLSLAECEIVAATVYAGAKPSAVKVTILDPNGDPLKTSNYNLIVEPDSDALDSKGKLIEGKNVHVKAIGKGANVDTETYVEGDFTVAKNIGNAKFKVNNTLTYTGEELKPDDDWVNANVTVTLKGASNPKAGTDFEITGYQNNVKKGTMTVYVAGKGDYSGLNKFKVKIVAKPFGK